MNAEATKFKGIIAATVTPFTESQEINKESTADLMDHLIDSNVHGLFVISGAGEFSTLSFGEKRELLEVVVQKVDGRVPVYAGTGTVTTQETVELTQMAEELGVDAVTVIAPYAIHPSEEELYQHYKEVAGCTDLPVILYNHPGITGLNLSADLVGRLSKLDNVKGIKDSSGDLTLTMEYISQQDEDFSVLAGIDKLIYPSLVCGARGSISSSAGIVPELVSSIYEYFKQGEYGKALDTQRALLPLRKTYDLGTYPAMIKQALNMLGWNVGKCRAPVTEMTKENTEKLRRILEQTGEL